MRLVPLKLFWALLFLAVLTAGGCMRQTGQSNAAKLENLPGTYRILKNSGEAHGQSFRVEDKNGLWYLSDEEGTRSMRPMSASEIEAVFGKEMADKSRCLEIAEPTPTAIICATEPGLKTTVRIGDYNLHRDFTSDTGYFVYVSYKGISNLEKIQ